MRLCGLRLVLCGCWGAKIGRCRLPWDGRPSNDAPDFRAPVSMSWCVCRACGCARVLSWHPGYNENSLCEWVLGPVTIGDGTAASWDGVWELRAESRAPCHTCADVVAHPSPTVTAWRHLQSHLHLPRGEGHPTLGCSYLINSYANAHTHTGLRQLQRQRRK